MKLGWKQIVLEITAVLAFGFLQFFLFAILIFTLISGFFPSIDEMIRAYELNLQCFFILLGILIFEYYIIKSFWDKGSVVLKTGMILILIMGIIPFSFCSYEVVNYCDYYQDFNAEVWNSKEVKPKAMVRSLLVDSTCTGMQRGEVLDKLGGEIVDDLNELVFSTEFGTPLVFHFDSEGNLIRYYLRQINW